MKKVVLNIAMELQVMEKRSIFISLNYKALFSRVPTVDILQTWWTHTYVVITDMNTQRAIPKVRH